MSMHKPGCTAQKDLDFWLISRNPSGPDQELRIDCYEAAFDRSITQDGFQKTIQFNYCPICGYEYDKEI